MSRHRRPAARHERTTIARLLAAVACVLCMLTGCSPPEPEPAPQPRPTTAAPSQASSSALPPPTETAAPAVWPLTGTAVADPSLASVSPVLGVKVENSGPARPWVGLGSADIVFVEMVEGGLTRFHAVYHSRVPEIIEPVRSLRPMDAAILGPWNGTLLASGGQGPFISRVESVVGLRTQDRGDPGFHRDGARPAPHNVYLRTSEALPALPAPGELPPLARFGEPPSTAGGPSASLLRVSYPGARSGWAYSPDTGSYLRSDSGTDSVEADGTRISARNVLLLDVTTRDTGLLDPAGSPVPETVLTGSGSLRLFAGGRMVQGSWSKGGDDEPFALTDAAGLPLVLSPGNTWVELLPERGDAGWE